MRLLLASLEAFLGAERERASGVRRLSETPLLNLRTFLRGSQRGAAKAQIASRAHPLFHLFSEGLFSETQAPSFFSPSSLRVSHDHHTLSPPLHLSSPVMSSPIDTEKRSAPHSGSEDDLKHDTDLLDLAVPAEKREELEEVLDVEKTHAESEFNRIKRKADMILLPMLMCTYGKSLWGAGELGEGGTGIRREGR